MIALIVQVLVHKNTNACKADVHPHNHITEEDPGCDETVAGTMGELLHYVGSAGLNPNAIAGEPLVMRFTHRSWTGKSSSGIPRAAVKNVVAIFDDIKYLMKACILLQINRPCLMI